MAQKTEVVAMLLAGGQGSRLGVLTKNIAKPAVPYGGNYRIIDFPLSNCVNSGIYTVGVLTQYQPLELNDYLGNGQPWDLDRQNGGIHILSPYEAIGGAEWYKGTANAIYQNINFIEKYDPEYVVILSGDHIYKMNYAKMVDFHKKNNADCTIAVLEVPWEEASRFGILATNDDDRIYEFAEKPKDPAVIDSFLVDKSVISDIPNPDPAGYCMASMGIYVFSQKVLEEAMSGTEMDFGKEIIPGMLGKKKLCAYVFNGYWEDIGTIRSFFDANLALTDDVPPFDFYKKGRTVYTHSRFLPGARIFNSHIERCDISDGCLIRNSTLERSIIGVRSIIKEGTYMRNVIMMGADNYDFNSAEKYPRLGIGRNCHIENAIIDKNASIGDNCNLSPEGKPDKWEAEGLYVRDGILIVTKNAVIPSNTSTYNM